MDNSSLEVILWKSFAETESLYAFVKSVVNGFNDHVNTEQCAIEITLQSGYCVKCGKVDDSSESYDLDVAAVFSGFILAPTGTLTPPVLSLLKELISKRSAEHTKYHDRVSRSIIRVLGVTLHDVRNTLGSISGITQLVEMDASDKPEVVAGLKDIGKIITSFDESSSVLMKLLRGQELKYTKSPFSLTDVCNSILKRSARVYQLSSIQLHSSIQNDVLCLGDEEHVRDIFMELLTNAASALDGSGGEITVSVTESRGIAEISIGHSGSPVPLEVQEYIFLPFFTTKDKGRGLGLTKITRYLKDWGGGIELLPTPEQPVRFVVTLPTTIL